jgi:DNA-binding HxlR family transcriptional regulator
MKLPRLEPDVYSPLCPTRTVLDHVMSRWGVLVLLALSEQMHRFAELRRKIGGVSEKMLAQTLSVLETDGFVQRTAYAEVPPRVEYRLTPLGAEIAEHVGSLVGWIETNVERVEAARTERRAATPASKARG